MATPAEIARLNAQLDDLDHKTGVLLGATTGTRRGPAAKAAALSGYLNAIEGKGPSSYDDLVKQQAADDAKAQREAEAAARQAAAESERQQRMQDKADEREWRANQAALERKSREQMKRDEIKSRPAPRDPVADHMAKKQAEQGVKDAKEAKVREDGYLATLRNVNRAREQIIKHGNSLFGPYETSGFNTTLGKLAGTESQKGRELYAQTMKELELSAAEAMRGTGPITENERATLRGTVGADVSDQEQALEILDRLEENARARRPLWNGDGAKGAPLEPADEDE